MKQKAKLKVPLNTFHRPRVKPRHRHFDLFRRSSPLGNTCSTVVPEEVEQGGSTSSPPSPQDGLYIGFVRLPREKLCVC